MTLKQPLYRRFDKPDKNSVAEIGVAMKNADKQVFPVADIVTETNDNEGIAVVLKDFIL